MSSLVPRAGGGGTVGRPSSQSRGSAGSASTTATDFSLKVETWRDVPAETQAAVRQAAASGPSGAGAGEVLAELVVTLRGHARRIDGWLHQERVAARAYRDRLVVARMVRPLQRRADGRLAPISGWGHHGLDVHRPETPPEVRKTPVGEEIAPGPVVTVDEQGIAGGVRPDHVSGADVELYLPAVVRDGLAAAVPTPALWVGSLVQYSTKRGAASGQELIVLRKASDAGAMVRAFRGHHGTGQIPPYTVAELAALPWQVLQVSYDLTPERAGIEQGQCRRLGR